MSINAVQITPADDRYAPPEGIIELAVVEDDMDEIVREKVEGSDDRHWTIKRPRKLVLLSFSKYEENSEGSTTKREITFPEIDLNDLIRALNAFGIAGGAIHFGEPPVRVTAPAEESATE